MGKGIKFYATRDDLLPLLNRLNEDSEIAFLMPDGDTRWKAVQQISTFREGKHYLWHLPSGPLYYERPPHLPSQLREMYKSIPDPWTGWDDQLLPERYQETLNPIYMGAYWKGWIQVPSRTKEDVLVKPNLPITPSILIFTIQHGTYSVDEALPFEHDIFWRANYFRLIGSPAHPETEKWWARFKRWFTKQTTRIIQVSYTPKPYAFPNAYRKINTP